MGNVKSTPPSPKPKQKMVTELPAKAISCDDQLGTKLDNRVFRQFKRPLNVSLKEWILLLREEDQEYQKAQIKSLTDYVAPEVFENLRRLSSMEEKARRGFRYHRSVLPIPTIVPAPRAPPNSAPRMKKIPLTRTARVRMDNAMSKRNLLSIPDDLNKECILDVRNLPGSVSSLKSISSDPTGYGGKNPRSIHSTKSKENRETYSIAKLFDTSGRRKQIEEAKIKVDTSRLLERAATKLNIYVDKREDKSDGSDIEIRTERINIKLERKNKRAKSIKKTNKIKSGETNKKPSTMFFKIAAANSDENIRKKNLQKENNCKRQKHEIQSINKKVELNKVETKDPSKENLIGNMSKIFKSEPKIRLRDRNEKNDGPKDAKDKLNKDKRKEIGKEDKEALNATKIVDGIKKVKSMSNIQETQRTEFENLGEENKNILTRKTASTTSAKLLTTKDKSLSSKKISPTSEGLSLKSKRLSRRSQGLSPRSKGLSPRSERLSPRSKGLSPRSKGLSAKSKGLSPKSKGLSPRSQGLSPRSQGLSPRSQGLSQRSQGLSPKSKELSPKLKGLSPRSEGLSPRSEGLSPRSQGLSPRSQGLSPKSKGLSPKSKGLSPKSKGLSPRSQGLSPRSQGLSTRSQGLSQRSQGLSPKSKGLSPRSQGLSPRSQGLSPRSQGLSPKSKELYPKSKGLSTRSKGLSPKSKGLSPRSKGLSPRSKGLSPKSKGLSPKSQGLSPRSIGLSPRSKGLSPRSKGLSPRSKGLSPRSKVLSPRSKRLSPKSQRISPKSQRMSPRSKLLSPRSKGSSPRSQGLSPKSKGLSPRSQRISPRSQRTSPRSQRISPRSQRISPRSQRISPRSQRISPRSQRISPRSQRISPRLQGMSPRSQRISPRSQRISPRLQRMSPRSEGSSLKRSAVKEESKAPNKSAPSKLAADSQHSQKMTVMESDQINNKSQEIINETSQKESNSNKEIPLVIGRKLLNSSQEKETESENESSENEMAMEVTPEEDNMSSGVRITKENTTVGMFRENETKSLGENKEKTKRDDLMTAKEIRTENVKLERRTISSTELQENKTCLVNELLKNEISSFKESSKNKHTTANVKSDYEIRLVERKQEEIKPDHVAPETGYREVGEEPKRETISLNESPENETISLNESPENETSFVNESLKNETSFVNESPKNKTSFVNESPENRTSFVNESPENKTRFVNESPENKTSFVNESPENKTSFVNESPKNKTSFVNESPENKTRFVNRSPENKTSFVNESPENKTSFENESPKNKTSFVNESPENKTSFGNESSENETSFGNELPKYENSPIEEFPELNMKKLNLSPEKDRLANEGDNRHGGYQPPNIRYGGYQPPSVRHGEYHPPNIRYGGNQPPNVKCCNRPEFDLGKTQTEISLRREMSYYREEGVARFLPNETYAPQRMGAQPTTLRPNHATVSSIGISQQYRQIHSRPPSQLLEDIDYRTVQSPSATSLSYFRAFEADSRHINLSTRRQSLDNINHYQASESRTLRKISPMSVLSETAHFRRSSRSQILEQFPSLRDNQTDNQYNNVAYDNYVRQNTLLSRSEMPLQAVQPLRSPTLLNTSTLSRSQPKLFYAEPFTRIESRPNSTASDLMYMPLQNTNLNNNYSNHLTKEPLQYHKEAKTIRMMPTQPIVRMNDPQPLPQLENTPNKKKWRLTTITNEGNRKKLPKISLIRYKIEDFSTGSLDNEDYMSNYQSRPESQTSRVTRSQSIAAPGRRLSVISGNRTRVLKILESTPLTPVNVTPDVTQFLFPHEMKSRANSLTTLNEKHIDSIVQTNPKMDMYTQTDGVSISTQTKSSLSSATSIENRKKHMNSERKSRTNSLKSSGDRISIRSDRKVGVPRKSLPDGIHTGRSSKTRSSSMGPDWR